jgi:PBSX family phage terminase large subunit
MTKINLSTVISPSFIGLHKDIKQELYTHHWLAGGRGSTKSSFVSGEIVLGIMKDPYANAMAIRKVGLYLKDSVYEQFMWAIHILGVDDYWVAKVSPMELVYKPTGQKIIFRGADKPKKLKSTKLRSGYFKYIWYEEVSEFNNPEELRTINQSLMRGGEKFQIFYSYNPPKSQRSWVNSEVLVEREDRIVHHSDYRTVPKDWLGEAFMVEAEHLKKVNYNAYDHEYLGAITGTGGEIFNNLDIRPITNEEIEGFEQIRIGVDFGYSIDPFTYVRCNYDRKHKTLYIFDEIFKVGLSNINATNLINERKDARTMINCDSAEPKSIAEMKSYGLRVKGAKKGKDSIDYGIKFLQSLEVIVIDNSRCINIAREFLNYEYEIDNLGDFKANYPDRNNHTIDAIRYALSDDMTHGTKLKSIGKSDFGL